MSTKTKNAPATTKTSRSGVVRFYVHGRSPQANGQRMQTDFTTPKMIAAIKGGLRVRELSALQASLDMPMERLAPKLGISRATFHRRKAGGLLRPEESDRVVRFARLMGKAVQVFE